MTTAAIKMKRYWGENRILLRMIYALAWPSVVEQILQTVVQYADSAMVGKIGAEASAAIGLTTTMTWLVNAPLFAMGIGVLSAIAESIGAGAQEKARQAGVQAVFITVILGALLGIATMLVSPFLPGWLGADPTIHKDASLYFSIICFPMIFRASVIILGSVLRGAGDTKSPMIVNLCMNGVNILINFLLIYETRQITFGIFPVTIWGAGLGIVGAALGTAVSYLIGGTLMFFSYLRHADIAPKGLPFKIDRPIMLRCLKIGFPVALERIGASLGQVVFTALVTRLGTIALASHSIALTAEQAFYLPGYGMQAAASTLAGNALGENDRQKLIRTTVLITGISVAVMTITGAVLFLFPQAMMSLFTPDTEVIRQGISILRIVAVSEPLFAVVIILEGIFNGIGDTKAPFFFSMFSMWGVRIAGTCLCLFALDGGLNAVWVCMVADNVTRCILLSMRFVRGSWKKRFQSEKLLTILSN